MNAEPTRSQLLAALELAEGELKSLSETLEAARRKAKPLNDRVTRAYAAVHSKQVKVDSLNAELRQRLGEDMRETCGYCGSTSHRAGTEACAL